MRLFEGFLTIQLSRRLEQAFTSYSLVGRSQPPICIKKRPEVPCTSYSQLVRPFEGFPTVQLSRRLEQAFTSYSLIGPCQPPVSNKEHPGVAPHILYSTSAPFRGLSNRPTFEAIGAGLH